MTSLKRDKICPQCEHRKLWFVERVLVPVREPTFHNRVVPLAVVAETRWTGRVDHQGEFESYICAKCGFTEWYATRLDELKADPSRGVFFIDDEPKAGLR